MPERARRGTGEVARLTTEDEAMIQLELTNEEEQDLREEVEKRLTELDHEIAHTDSAAVKQTLKRRQQSLRKLLEKLPDIAGPAS